MRTLYTFLFFADTAAMVLLMYTLMSTEKSDSLLGTIGLWTGLAISVSLLIYICLLYQKLPSRNSQASK